MKRYSSIPGESAACQRAEQWLQSLDRAYEASGIDAKHPAAAPLQAMSADLATWERAISRGHHTPTSVGAAARVVNWLWEFQTLQSKANTRRRSVTRRLTL